MNVQKRKKQEEQDQDKDLEVTESNVLDGKEAYVSMIWAPISLISSTSSRSFNIEPPSIRIDINVAKKYWSRNALSVHGSSFLREYSCLHRDFPSVLVFLQIGFFGPAQSNLNSYSMISCPCQLYYGHRCYWLAFPTSRPYGIYLLLRIARHVLFFALRRDEIFPKVRTSHPTRTVDR